MYGNDDNEEDGEMGNDDTIICPTLFFSSFVL